MLAAVEGVKAHQHAQARLKLANQALARTKQDSAGRKKTPRRLGKIHARVAHTRRALLHELTSAIVQGHASIVVEDLNAAGMLANRRLARVVSDRWFPSSKTCSGCGEVNADLTLADRVYACQSCGLVIDRDVNAAINLARYTPPSPAAPPLPAAA